MPGSPLSGRIANRVERLRQRRWRMASYRSEEEHIVLGGAPRSGTTVLRKLLDRHPVICSGAETKLFVPAAFNLAWLAEAYGIPRPELEDMRRRSMSQAAFIDDFSARAKAAAGKRRWAEKTPQNIRYLDWITERFPRVSIIHIIRDGRDVVCSMRRHPDWRWKDGAWQKVLVPRPLSWYARRWLADTAAGMAWRHDPRYIEVHYEDLVADPAASLRAICAAIGVTAGPSWLQAVDGPTGMHDTGRGEDESRLIPDASGPGPDRRPDYDGALSDASVGRWRTELGPEELGKVERICAARLEELGYET